MALQSLKGYIPLPPSPEGSNNQLPNITGLQTLDATSDRCGLVFKVPNGCTSITKVGFGGAAVAGASGSLDLDIRLETVDVTTGDPSGTLFSTSTNATKTLAFNDDNEWSEVTLGSGATVIPGEYIAIVLNVLSFTTATSVTVNMFGANDFLLGSTYSCLLYTSLPTN